MTTIMWFRRDLRLADNPALDAARADQEGMVPVFCLEPAILDGRFRSGARTQFLLDCLNELAQELDRLHSGLHVVRGRPEEELPKLAKRVGASEIHMCVDSGPYGHRRDERVAAALEESGARLCGHPGIFAVDDLDAIRTKAGAPFSVYTPFYRAWLDEPRRDVIGKPRKLPPLPKQVKVGNVPTLAHLGLSNPVKNPASGGERAAHERWRAFLADGVERYDEGRNDLAADTTSRLSPYLHFGCVSPRQLEADLPSGSGPKAFRGQLAWRDFYGQVLRSFPENRTQEYQERYRSHLKWRTDAAGLKAWKNGLTGFPLVDAGMRQLMHEGWMHNRARLVVGSFLTKDLGVDWREGEAHFMEYLLDGDMGNNNGNWQWIASVGVDPKPVFQRLFNPTRQTERFDPDGEYIRRWVPELKNLPTEQIAEPWKMTEDTQRELGCVIGQDYPEPILDHKQARQEAMDRFREASARGSS